MLRRTILTAGVALAAGVTVSDTADAGQRRAYRPCPPAVRYSAPATGYYVPQAAPAPQVVAPSPSGSGTVQPPGPSAGANVVRRFSYEPGTEGAAPAAAPVTAAPAYRPSAPAYRPAAPAARPSSGGGFRAGLTGEDRLRPGRGNR